MSANGLKSERAFTLVEMAVVMVIIGLIMLGVLPALMSMRASGARSATQADLRALMQATAAYVQANGCLPCPSPPTISNTNPAGFGYVRGDNTSGAACGTCNPAEGTVPFASLGIPITEAKDGWGHWITMRVDPALTANFGVVPPASPCLAGDLPPNTVTPTCTVLGASQKGLCRTGLSTAGRMTVETMDASGVFTSQQAAVVFVSYGVSGSGSFFEAQIHNSNNGQALLYASTVPACSTTGGYSRCNMSSSNTSSTTFINAPYVPTGSDPFDQVLAYADRNTLVSAFGNGSCQTVW